MEKQYWKKIVNSKLLNNRTTYILGIAALGIFFFFILGDDGPYLMRDSAVFMEPNAVTSQSYWLYTHFLKMCKFLCGEKYYLYIAYFVQASFAMVVSAFTTEYFRKCYNMTYFVSICVYLFTLLPYGYSLPENVVTHHIMTEALAIPLFQICLLFSCKSFLEKKSYNMVVVIITGGLLVLSRSQLLLIFPVIVFLVMLFYAKTMVRKASEFFRVKFKVMAAILTGIVLLTTISLLGLIFYRTTIGSQLLTAVSGRVMCLMEYEDRELFEGELQEIYDALYKNADEGKHIEKYFRTDSWRSYDIAENTNENTKECLPVIREFYADKYPDDMTEYALQSYYDRDMITKTLLANHIWDYIEMSIQLMIQSFVASVFIQPDAIRNLCYVITFFIYLGMLIVLYIAKVKVKVKKIYVVPMLITLLFLGTNVVFTNIIFYGQQRYVIYTFGMFYISWLIMLLGMYRKRKELTIGE